MMNATVGTLRVPGASRSRSWAVESIEGLATAVSVGRSDEFPSRPGSPE
jgi:hypothetical protein